jgi:hypothetical protein
MAAELSPDPFLVADEDDLDVREPRAQELGDAGHHDFGTGVSPHRVYGDTHAASPASQSTMTTLRPR